MNLVTYLFIGFGGFLGAIARVYFSSLVDKSSVTIFPLGTLGVNLLGSLVMGALFAYFQNSSIDNNLKVMITSGFLGAFTTYSTFSMQSVNLFLSGDYIYALANMLANVLGSVLMAWLGYKIITHLI